MEKDTKKQDLSAQEGNGEIEKLQKELEESKKKCEEYLSGWKRERADFLNYKKDEMERIGELAKYANTEIILKIIPILDNIYLAESHIPEELQKHQWSKGFEAIKNQLCDFLDKEGIEPIKTEGEKFNPSLMEAVEEIEGEKPGMVVEETQKGYTMYGRIIRVAKVKVSK